MMIPRATTCPMRRYQHGVRHTFVTPEMMMITKVVMVMMMPPLDLRAIADGLVISVETSFLVAARVLEWRLDVFVDGSLAVRSWSG